MLGGKLTFHVIISMMVVGIPVIKLSSAQLPMPNGINYCGVGYNIIEGNPEGGDLSTGGVDPGLLLTRKIFELTFEEGKTSADHEYRIPDEVVFVQRNSAFTSSSLTTFYGTESYASKLSAQVSVEGGYEGALASAKFAASVRYQRVSEKTSGQGSVFLSNETIYNLGSARYQKELALSGNHGLTNGFIADACRLPATYTEQSYMEFLDDWGTHVVIEVALGIREGENLEEKRSSFVSFAAQNVEGSVSAEGAYAGFSASLSVDMESFTSNFDSGNSFGKSYSKYRIGSESLNEPISISLIAMSEVFEPDFWTRLDDYISAGHCTSSMDVGSVKRNMETALEGYAIWKSIKQSMNPEVRIPLTWPEGVYGLPNTISGCANDNQDLKWNEGYRIHTTSSGDYPGTKTPSNAYMWGGWWTESYTRQEFCMKTAGTVDAHSKWEWQPGAYCIYKFGDQCPKGFESGNIKWDDDDDIASKVNARSGILPSGTYDDDTEIFFCCRNDAPSTRPIFLPTHSRFMLLARYNQCQKVDGMTETEGSLFWGTDPGSSVQSDVHPYEGLTDTNGVKLTYCYYHRYGDDGKPSDAELEVYSAKAVAGAAEIVVRVIHG